MRRFANATMAHFRGVRTTQEQGLTLHRYWASTGQSCVLSERCITGKERRITRWEHVRFLEAVQQRIDEHPEMMGRRPP